MPTAVVEYILYGSHKITKNATNNHKKYYLLK